MASHEMNARQTVCDDSTVGSPTQTRNTDTFEDRLSVGTKTIAWNTKRFCNHVAPWFSQFADFYQTDQFPEATFRKQCSLYLGTVCLPQCRKLSRLYVIKRLLTTEKGLVPGIIQDQ